MHSRDSNYEDYYEKIWTANTTQDPKYEEQKEFNQRCMNNAQLGSSYPNRDDRFTVCQMLWKKNFDPKQ